ncbi:MAG: class I SAM-dependent methyltransferase [Fulvivirga sp.]
MDKTYYHEYYIQERNHWWFLARLRILESKVAQIATDQKLKILNVGAATGATSQMLSKYGEVTSLEYDSDCCKFVREEIGLEVTEGSVLDLPYEDQSFDLVCAFDIIEHVDDDQTAVEEMKRVCAKGGNIFVTVPAFMSLWSDHDVINHHFRRYKKHSLQQLFKESGEVGFTSYFNFYFFIPIYLIRRISNILYKKDRKVKSDFNKFKPGILNNLMYAIFLMEKPWLRMRLKFPFGVSIMLIWENTKDDAG